MAKALTWCVSVEVTVPSCSTEAEAELLLTATDMDHNSSPMCFSALLHKGYNNTSAIVNSLLIVKKQRLSILSIKERAVG